MSTHSSSSVAAHFFHTAIRLFMLSLLAFGPTVNPCLASYKRIVGYFPAWSIYARNYQVWDIPADKLTHVNYAFANISDSGECMLGDPWADVQKPHGDEPRNEGTGSFGQLRRLKRKFPHLKTLISVGGWSWSKNFSSVASTASARRRFANSCVNFMVQHGFDGIDVDWEYPVSAGSHPEIGKPEDKENYTLLLAELRSQLDAKAIIEGHPYLLTIAAPANPSTYANFELRKIHRYLDFINIMSYDLHGQWENTTNLPAPLFRTSTDPSPMTVSDAVQAYLDAGIPSNKIVVGVPSYGRGWGGVPNTNNGLYQPGSLIPKGTFEAGVFDYRDIHAKGYRRYWHAEAMSPWIYNPSTGIFIGYDDSQSISSKANFIREKNLGGAMFWELSGDIRDSNAAHSLINTLYLSLMAKEPRRTRCSSIAVHK